ncbi:MAG: hypothetical protein Q4C81_10165 [Kocuria sp.]|nr:hypothetical protein [Kocuria sp.]
MTALARSVHASTIRRTPIVEWETLSPQASPGHGSVSGASQVTGVVTQVMGPHAVALDLESTAVGQFREEIVLHGESGWNRDVQVGAHIRITGEWELADWHLWEPTERSHYLAIRGRLDFRIGSIQSANLSYAA